MSLEPPLPPGPRSMLLTTMAYVRDPYGSALRLQARYGATYTLPTAFGKMVVTGDPEGVREILGADPDTYGALGVELLGPVLGEASMILLGGARHRAARKLFAPSFHGARMRAYGATMRAITRDVTSAWAAGHELRLQRSTQAISLRVIIETVFGVTDPARVAEYQRALVRLIEALRPSFMFVERLRTRLFPPWTRFQKITRTVEAMVYTEIAERRARPEVGEDILSLLVASRYDDGSAPPDREILEQIMTLLGAGHETTAIALAWACHHIAADPAVEERLIEELRALGPDPEPDAIARLPYLEAVCLETLRLQPLAPTIARLLVRPLRLRGHELPAGISVGASVIAVHRNPDLYPEPEAFRPERFVGKSYAPHEFLPFGGGARRCLGAAFATYEMKLVLATILERFVLRSAEPGPVAVRARNTVVGPHAGIRMIAQPRVR
jgi:cytochrome P450 family 110